MVALFPSQLLRPGSIVLNFQAIYRFLFFLLCLYHLFPEMQHKSELRYLIINISVISPYDTGLSMDYE